MRVLVIGILIGILALTACAAPASSPRGEGEPDAETPVVAPAEGDSQPSGKLGPAVIIYERSGGLAGVSERWSIYPDGRIMAGDGREWQVKPEQVKQLISDIEASGFFDLSGQYMPRNPCCDRFTYSLVVRSDDKVNSVTTMDATPDVPANLGEVLGAVRSFINAAQEDK